MKLFPNTILSETAVAVAANGLPSQVRVGLFTHECGTKHHNCLRRAAAHRPEIYRFTHLPIYQLLPPLPGNTRLTVPRYTLQLLHSTPSLTYLSLSVPAPPMIRLILFTGRASSSLPTMEPSWNSTRVILPSNHGILMELDAHHPPFQPWNPHGTQIRLILFTRRASSSLPTMESSWNSMCVILPSNHGTLMELDVRHPPFQPWNPHGTQIHLILFTRRVSSSLPTMEPSWNSV
ncbi:hypothetical protein F4604DRAFT_1918478 [Suillus subluteus]|nr:hypothetical protein F4604DRAFT_1918478 [Suillus subluteus]